MFGNTKNKDSFIITLYVFTIGMLLSIVLPPAKEDINYAGSLPHHIIQTGDFVMNKVVIFGLIFLVSGILSFLLSKISTENKNLIKIIRIFCFVYVLVGIFLSVFGYLRIF